MLFKRSKRQSSRVLISTRDQDPYHFGGSDVHGIGVFAKKDIDKDEKIGKFLHLRQQNHHEKINRFVRDELCRFMNHGDKPNVFLVINGDLGLEAKAIRRLHKNEELFINYHDAFQFLMDNFFPFFIDVPVLVRTQELKNHGGNINSHGLLDEIKRIKDGAWRKV
jgi:hypothetical protein